MQNDISVKFLFLDNVEFNRVLLLGFAEITAHPSSSNSLLYLPNCNRRY